MLPGRLEVRSLPEWFGSESTLDDYIDSARRLPTYLAWPDGPGSSPAGPELLR